MSAHTLEKATDFSASACDVPSKRGQCYNWEQRAVSAVCAQRNGVTNSGKDKYKM